MNKIAVQASLDGAIQKFEKKFDSIQSRGYEEELQSAINELGGITLEALKDFRKAILDCD